MLALNLLLSLTTVLSLASSAISCVCMRTYMLNDPFTGDSMTAQLGDDGSVICNGSDGPKFLAGYNTRFNIPCTAGYSLTIWGNGHQIEYNTPHGYFAWSQSAIENVYQCEELGVDQHPINCTTFTGIGCQFCNFSRKRNGLARSVPDMSPAETPEEYVKRISEKGGKAVESPAAAAPTAK